ncbi:hypothetical protein HJG54_11855 [Leptolyngbya sp. NK1-12]|uniref:Uncharacterized protein n=1 Tax=Leptolyngbya sp. NK1-12 TaxID=2547451 RepID=A0AA97AQG2_9CYAN|nr:hypothetical protein [Leptolyngbya sp. NK1-12]WNZ23478.1 hypothetical protein HJG54_11855 [Leptolyngbya sp. NK1-12]
MLPARLLEPLQLHLQQVRQTHQRDLQQGYGSVYLPFALERNYPHADRAWIGVGGRGFDASALPPWGQKNQPSGEGRVW